MAKKKRKKFQKSQLLSLFKAQNYQKVISKAKQFQIDGMSEDELHKILTDSYYGLAESNFMQGDTVRAIRDIDSLLKIDSAMPFQITKLKYLCYIDNFSGAVELAEELLSLKPTAKRKKEIVFLYLMANLYNNNYEIDKKLLKTLSASKQNYILGFCEFMQDNIESALNYFETSKPKAKEEKKNLVALKAILSNQEIEADNSIKPLYHFLLTGEDIGVGNSKSARELKKELKDSFKSQEKNIALKSLLELKAPTSTDIILKQKLDKEQELKLLYNNVSLLVDRKNYSEALKLFVKYRASFVKFTESATLFINIKKRIEDKRSDSVVLGFLSNYLRVHHKKIAPFQIDMILLFLITENHMREAINLAQEYDRESFVLFLKDIPMMKTFSPHMQITFNRVMKKYSKINDTLFMLTVNNIINTDEEFYDLTNNEKRTLINRISILITVVKNLDKPHKRYKSTLFELFKALAMIIQNFSYDEEETNYLKLSNLIEHYIEYFDFNRVDLVIDIKALFVSISKEESVRVEGYVEEEDIDLFRMRFNAFWGHDYKDDKYDFDEKEYDLSLIKKACIDNLKAQTEEPFKPLMGIEIYRFHRIIHQFIMDLIGKAIELGRKDTNKVIDEILQNLDIKSMTDSYYRDEIPTEVKEYAKKDIKIAMLYFNYILLSVNPNKIEFVWYLKWADAYVNLVEDYVLEKDAFFDTILNNFFKIQNKKKFKSINAKYKKNLKKFKKEEIKGTLF